MILLQGLVKREIWFCFLRNISLTRYNSETHYETLQLSRNCTQRDIKEAFIKLSKKYHPDKNTDRSTHSKFVKLNEAYTVLNRPETRKNYDLSLVPPKFDVQRSRRTKFDNDFTSRGPDPFTDKSFWENRDRSKDAENMTRPYYGIKGINKVSNDRILYLLVLFAIFGVGLQVLLIKKSTTFSRRVLDEQSSRNADIYREVRARAMEQDKDIDKLKQLQEKSDALQAARKLSPLDEVKR